MDWTKVKTALLQIAPFLAGTLGTPFAGVAVQTICDALGAKEKTPEALLSAVQSATPTQLQNLHTSDDAHREFMAKIGFDTLAKVLDSEVADKSSARGREIAIRDHTPAVLAALAVLMFVAILVFTASGLRPDATMRDTFLMLAGAAIALVKDVYGYFFGSSTGSKTKDETIAGLSQ